jgi:hypothetical protein
MDPGTADAPSQFSMYDSTVFWNYRGTTSAPLLHVVADVHLAILDGISVQFGTDAGGDFPIVSVLAATAEIRAIRVEYLSSSPGKKTGLAVEGNENGYVTVFNCSFFDTTVGIVRDTGDSPCGVTVEWCTFSNCSQNGIRIESSSIRLAVKYCHFSEEEPGTETPFIAVTGSDSVCHISVCCFQTRHETKKAIVSVFDIIIGHMNCFSHGTLERALESESAIYREGERVLVRYDCWDCPVVPENDREPPALDSATDTEPFRATNTFPRTGSFSVTVHLCATQ